MALLYAQVRQADGPDYRNILLDDRKLSLKRRIRGRFESAQGLSLFGFENDDSPARAEMRWTQDEILAALRNLGLQADSSLSVLCVEMMPTLNALRTTQASKSAGLTDLAGSMLADRSGFGDPTGGLIQDYEVRPLSDALGHYRILRTSPLTPVPQICCTTCV